MLRGLPLVGFRRGHWGPSDSRGAELPGFWGAVAPDLRTHFFGAGRGRVDPGPPGAPRGVAGELRDHGVVSLYGCFFFFFERYNPFGLRSGPARANCGRRVCEPRGVASTQSRRGPVNPRRQPLFFGELRDWISWGPLGVIKPSGPRDRIPRAPAWRGGRRVCAWCARVCVSVRV